MADNQKQPKNSKLWIIIIILLFIIGGFIVFELGKVTGKAKPEATQTSLSQTSHTVQSSSIASKKTSSSSQKNTSSASSKDSDNSNTLNSPNFKLNYRNTSAAGWNAAAVYYGAHALGYSDILSDVDNGHISLNNIRDSGMPLGDNGSFFTYHFTGAQIQENQVMYMGFSFTNKQINYYSNGNYDSPDHTVSLQQVLDYINVQHAGQAIENMNCTFNN